MFLKIFFILATISICESVYVYSNFWAPLFDPRILNYRVDVKFDPEAGINARDDYESKYGYRGANLIEDLSKGRGPQNNEKSNDNNIKFYYTYKGAYDQE